MERRNIEKALLQVERNKGVGGEDGMQTDEFRDYENTNYQQLRKEVIAGVYKPSPVKKVEMPKTSGRSKNGRHTHGKIPPDRAIY